MQITAGKLYKAGTRSEDDDDAKICVGDEEPVETSWHRSASV